MTGTVIDLRSDDVRARKAATSTGDFEVVAARCVAVSTGAVVYIQDDGSAPSMPDLRLEWADGCIEFGEVFTDMPTEYGNLLGKMKQLGDGLPWVIDAPPLVYDWFVSVGPLCVLKTASKRVVELLANVEASGFTPSVAATDLKDGKFETAATELHLVEATAADRGRAVARVHIYPPAVEGSFKPNWDAFSNWLDAVCQSEKSADVWRKLASTPAGLGHVVLGATMSSDGEAYHALSSDVHPSALPRRDPDCPTEVSRLWVLIAQGLGSRVLTWDTESGWYDTRMWRYTAS